MSTSDDRINEVLSKYGEPFGSNVWRVQGTAVILHKALERIAAKARITFSPPTIIRAERDEAVLLVKGMLANENNAMPTSEWSIGEALIGANYRVSGKQAAYVYAMAEKRAKDRVILKLIGLHGDVYSEEEADEFREERPRPASLPVERKSIAQHKRDGTFEEFKAGLTECKTAADVDAYTQNTRDGVGKMWPDSWRDAVDDAVTERKVEMASELSDSDASAIFEAMRNNIKRADTIADLAAWKAKQSIAIDALPPQFYDELRKVYEARYRQIKTTEVAT